MTQMRSAVAKVAKRTANMLHAELMSEKRFTDMQTGHLKTIDEYLKLLTKCRNVAIPFDSNRLRLLYSLVGTGIAEGAHIVASLHEVAAIPGDVCECGVGSGATSALLANELRDTSKTLWLYDTFTGLPKPTEEDRLIDDIDDLGSMAAYEGKMRHPESEVIERLSAIKIPTQQYRIVPGLFEDAASQGALPERISFAYIDFDFYIPILEALRAFSPRLAPGGVMIVDDYGYFSGGAKLAVDRFVAKNSLSYSQETPDYCGDRFIVLRKHSSCAS